AHLVFAELRNMLMVAVLQGVIRKELSKRHIHRRGYLRQRVQRGNGMSILHPREIAAQQPRTFLNVPLRHSLLQAVSTYRVTDVHNGVLLTGPSFGIWVRGVHE